MSVKCLEEHEVRQSACLLVSEGLVEALLQFHHGLNGVVRPGGPSLSDSASEAAAFTSLGPKLYLAFPSTLAKATVAIPAFLVHSSTRGCIKD